MKTFVVMAFAVAAAGVIFSIVAGDPAISKPENKVFEVVGAVSGDGQPCFVLAERRLVPATELLKGVGTKVSIPRFFLLSDGQWQPQRDATLVLPPKPPASQPSI